MLRWATVCSSCEGSPTIHTANTILPNSQTSCINHTKPCPYQTTHIVLYSNTNSPNQHHPQHQTPTPPTANNWNHTHWTTTTFHVKTNSRFEILLQMIHEVHYQYFHEVKIIVHITEHSWIIIRGCTWRKCRTEQARKGLVHSSPQYAEMGHSM